MSVRQSLLAILNQGPRYGSRLKSEFDNRTGATWLLDVGQVHNTLERLERDGPVGRSEVGGEEQHSYGLTAAGRTEVASWLGSPVMRGAETRDELAIKSAIATTLPGVDIASVIQIQRATNVHTLQGPTKTKNATDDQDTAEEMARPLLVDSIIFPTAAELRWLDRSETRLARAAAAGLVSAMPLSTELPKRGRPVTARADRQGK